MFQYMIFTKKKSCFSKLLDSEKTNLISKNGGKCELFKNILKIKFIIIFLKK